MKLITAIASSTLKSMTLAFSLWEGGAIMEQEEKNKIPILADKFFAEMREQKFTIEEAYTLLDNLTNKIYFRHEKSKKQSLV